MLRSLMMGVSAISLASAAAGNPLSEDAKNFGTRENVRAMAISPSGSKAAILVSGQGSVTAVQLADFSNGQISQLTTSDGRTNALRWCSFAGETQLVCKLDGIDNVDDRLVAYSRLITLRTDGSNLRPLGQRASSRDRHLRQFDGDVIDWLPGEDGTILMARDYVPEINTTGTLLGRTKSGLGVDRIDLRSMKSSAIEAPRDGVDSYLTDGRGTVRLYGSSQTDNNSAKLTGLTKFMFRSARSRDWRELGTYNSRDGTGYNPLAIDASTDSLYSLQKTNGRDALFRLKLDGSGTATMIASDPAVDIDGVIRLGPGQRIIGYSYADERRRAVYFDGEFTALQASLGKAIPKQPLIDFVGASADGQKLLILASGDTSPGTFYRYDKTSRKLEEILPVRPELASRTLSPVKTVRVTAADGASIPAYLTIPAGSSGKNLPAVVLPHGGPSARDEWGFDWLPQFLAARGYAVIQPNYRGSAGYGDNWMAGNGFRGWKTSIADVSSAARYLASQGIADPKRIAIVGWSYGGYAALQSAAVEPNLYRAAVAIAPVTDLELLKAEAEGFTNARLVQEFVGSGAHVTEGSPIRNVEAIKVPVLMVHGDRDINVSIDHSEKMLAALKGRGKRAELVRFKGLDHQLDDSGSRVEMLNRIGQFLDSETR